MSGALCHGLCVGGVGVRKKLVSVNYRTFKRLGRLIRFFCGLLGVTRGRFLSMISSAAHLRWPLRPPSWIWFPSIRRQTPASIHPFFCGSLGWLEEGSFRWSAPPLIQDGRYGCQLGFGFRRLDDKRLRRFIRFFVAHWGWLDEGSFRLSAPLLIQDGHYGRYLGLDFRWFSDLCLGRLVRFFL
jgi:hypothetical protein